MRVEQAVAQLAGSRHDRFCQHGLQRAATQVGARGRHLLQAESPDQARGKALLADFEDAKRALRLRTPVPVCGYLDWTEGVVLDA